MGTRDKNRRLNYIKCPAQLNRKFEWRRVARARGKSGENVLQFKANLLHFPRPFLSQVNTIFYEYGQGPELSRYFESKIHTVWPAPLSSLWVWVQNIGCSRHRKSARNTGSGVSFGPARTRSGSSDSEWLRGRAPTGLETPDFSRQSPPRNSWSSPSCSRSRDAIKVNRLCNDVTAKSITGLTISSEWLLATCLSLELLHWHELFFNSANLMKWSSRWSASSLSWEKNTS